MRDPWKALAAFLALVLAAVALLRLPSAAPSASPERTFDTSSSSTGAATLEPPAPEWERASAPVAAESSSDPPSVDLLLRLLDPTGQVVDGYCSACLSDGTRFEPVMSPGLLTFYDLPPGTIHLVAEVRGYLRLRETVLLPSQPDAQTHELVLTPSARIPVYFFTPDGRRLSEVIREHDRYASLEECLPSVIATADGTLPWLPSANRNVSSSQHSTWSSPDFLSAQTDPDGTLSLWTMPPLTLHVLLRNLPLAVHPLPEVVDRLEIVLDPAAILSQLCSVSARFLDARTGEPLRAGHPLLASGRSGHVLIANAETGVFSRRSLPPGPYDLSAAFGASGQHRAQILLEPGQSLDLGIIRLAETSDLVIQVIAQPPVGPDPPQLWLQDVGSGPRLTHMTTFLWNSDPDGKARVPMPPGAYALAVVPPVESGWAAAGLRFDAPRAETVEVRLHRGALVTLRNSEPGLVPHRLWVLVDGHAACGNWSVIGTPRRIRLAPGEHFWILTDSTGAEVRRGSILVRAEDEAISVEVPNP